MHRDEGVGARVAALRMLLSLEPGEDQSVLFKHHVRMAARSMDAATLQAALEFHRMYVDILMVEIRERREASGRTAAPNARHQ